MYTVFLFPKKNKQGKSLIDMEYEIVYSKS